jgi:lysophospholipase L1-like esterase
VTFRSSRLTELSDLRGLTRSRLLAVTPRWKGVTVWSSVRGLAATAGVLAAVLLTAACHETTQATADPTGLAKVTPATTGTQAKAASPVQSAGPVVALGDSYTAGGMFPVDAHAKPAGCLRSTKAYPVLVANALGAPLTDVSCTNAGVKMMTAAQKTYLGTNPAQLDALKPDDKLVLLTLGGDDLGFLNVLQECMKVSIRSPSGRPCQAHYTAGGTDQLAASVTAEAAKITQVLAAIRLRAPQARVVVVGYPDLFPQSGGCWPSVPIATGDIAYLRGIEVSANAMLAADASAAGDTFVNTYTPTIGHDFCQPESNRDVEGLLPGSLALPFHPNAKGQQAMAAAVLKALKS